MRINLKDIKNLKADKGCDDYPNISAPKFIFAQWKENDDELTDLQLEWLTKDYPELVIEILNIQK